MGLLDEYFEYVTLYEKKLGELTVILMRKGAFLEILQRIPSLYGQYIGGDRFQTLAEISDKESQGKAAVMSVIVGYTLTSCDKSKPHSADNPLLVGIPVINYEDRRELILAHGYTIVFVDEVAKAAKRGELVKREVVEISSLALDMENSMLTSAINGAQTTNRIVNIYIQYQRKTDTRGLINMKCEDFMIIVGMSAIDIYTGENWVTEIYSTIEDSVHPVHEIYRFLSSHKPLEIIFDLDLIPDIYVDKYKDFLIKELELESYLRFIFRINDIIADFKKLPYQEQFLKSIFRPSTITSKSTSNLKLSIKTVDINVLSIIEELDLERLPYALQSYILLLQYCYEHNETIIHNINKPQVSWSDQHDHLVLAHNAMEQIDILPKSSEISFLKIKKSVINSLLSVVDNCATKMGSRFLRMMLIRPTVDVDLLNSYYNMIAQLLDQPDILSLIRVKLKSLPDVEHYNRKLSISTIKSKELHRLILSYSTIVELQNTIIAQGVESPCYKLTLPAAVVDQMNSFLTFVYSQFNLVHLEKCSDLPIYGKIDISEILDTLNLGSIFNYGLVGDLPIGEKILMTLSSWEELDQLTRELYSIYNNFKYITSYLSQVTDKTIEPTFERKLKVIRNDDKEDAGKLFVSLKCTQTIKTKLNSISIDPNIVGGSLSFSSKAKSYEITSPYIEQCINTIVSLTDTLEKKLYNKYKLVLDTINTFKHHGNIAIFCRLLDYIHNNAWCAKEYKLYIPVIDMSAETSFIEAKDLRHSIIERITNKPYVPNNVTVGTQREKAMLLFGVNSTGKTSLAKSLGLAVVMAQAGMCVPGQIRYKPYHQIITRMSGHDDIFKGQSSFIVEMLELRTILRQADANTLVIGDELCRGTETISGTALTVATIMTLMERGTSFIFSTHMHHLMEVDIINQLVTSGLRIAHLSAEYNKAENLLVYSRKIKDGPGSSIYGLEVCRGLDIDENFINLADKIRRDISGISPYVVATKTSRYNSKIYVDSCALCGCKIELQTHHIIEQAEADEEGFVGHYHKNESYNLVVLCRVCHQNLHAQQKHVELSDTSKGIILNLSAE